MPSLRAFPPLPVRQDWAPSYLSARAGAVNRDFAFNLVDPEGAPGADGRRYHSGVDWFAPRDIAVAAPRAGRVVRYEPSSDSSGPVFGGVLAIEETSGVVWVMRHVNPVAKLGSEVAPGDAVATVHAWDGGATHLHLEIWRTLAGGYTHENMLDPADVEWDPAALQQSARYYFEEFPHTKGGAGPAVVGNSEGYRQPAVAACVRLVLKARGLIVSTMKAEDGRTYVLSWAKGTYGSPFRFGPWQKRSDRDDAETQREGNVKRPLRPYQGRAASLYPWPAHS